MCVDIFLLEKTNKDQPVLVQGVQGVTGAHIDVQ